MLAAAALPSIRTRGGDAFRMSAVPAFEHYAFAVEFFHEPGKRDMTTDLIEFATSDAGGTAAARRSLMKRYRFSVPSADYEAMMGRIVPLLASWTGSRGYVFCVDGTETEFEARKGVRILSLASPCGPGAPDRAISAEVLRILHRYGPRDRLPTTSDWYGRKLASDAVPVQGAALASNLAAARR